MGLPCADCLASVPDHSKGSSPGVKTAAGLLPERHVARPVHSASTPRRLPLPPAPCSTSSAITLQGETNSATVVTSGAAATINGVYGFGSVSRPLLPPAASRHQPTAPCPPPRLFCNRLVWRPGATPLRSPAALLPGICPSRPAPLRCTSSAACCCPRCRRRPQSARPRPASSPKRRLRWLRSASWVGSSSLAAWPACPRLELLAARFCKAPPPSNACPPS
jgi:hypothetical protein